MRECFIQEGWQEKNIFLHVLQIPLQQSIRESFLNLAARHCAQGWESRGRSSGLKPTEGHEGEKQSSWPRELELTLAWGRALSLPNAALLCPCPTPLSSAQSSEPPGSPPGHLELNGYTWTSSNPA